MKKSVRLILTVLCALMILALPFILSSPSMLEEAKIQLSEYADKEGALLDLFMPSACAEETFSLPMDFSPGMAPDPALFTQDGYEDASITVKLETREESGVVWRIASISIKDASQLRTVTAGKLTSSSVALTSSMAKANNAIIAMNGDYFSNDPAKTSFEYRMGQKIRAKTNRKKDILIIDDAGDFHTFIKSEGVEEYVDANRSIVNAFTFGPALVQEGKALTMDTAYGYNPNGREPRAAFGQTGPLSYVMVIAEGRSDASQGVTHQELADFMYALGCTEAFNLDGGNSATLVFNGGYYMDKTVNNERALSDIIYFASAVDSTSKQ